MRCIICGEEERLEIKNKYSGFTVVQCGKCDVVFSDPMVNPGARWYQKEHSYYMRNTIGFERIEWEHNLFVKEKVALGGDLLDVGCGIGKFCLFAQKHGYRTLGLDYDQEAIEIGRQKFKIKGLYALDLDDFTAQVNQGRKYDVVTFFEVLEHLADPVALLRKIRPLLKAQGYICLSVPNRNRFPYYLNGDYPPHHLTQWSVDSLAHLLRQEGFEIVKLREKKYEIIDVMAYLNNRIKSGVSRKLTSYAIQKETPGLKFLMLLSISLYKIKLWLLEIVAAFLFPYFKIRGGRGIGLYAVARYHGE